TAVRRDSAALAALAESLELSGRMVDAIRAWNDARRVRPSAEYALHAGLLEATAGQREAAIRDLNAALRGSLSPASRALALRQLGFVQRSAGNLSASAKAFERAATLDRRDRAALVALAEVHLAS